MFFFYLFLMLLCCAQAVRRRFKVNMGVSWSARAVLVILYCHYHYLVFCIFWCCESVLELAFVLCQVVCGRFKVSLGVSWSARAVFVHGFLGSIPLAPTVRSTFLLRYPYS